MAPRKNKTKKSEEDVVMKDPATESHDGEDGAGGDNNGDGDDGGIAGGKDDQSDDEESDKPKRRTTVQKSDEEKAAEEVRKEAATEALLSDRFVWKDGKPEPFENLKQEVKVAWGQLKGENHCGFIDRLHKNWRDLEQETKRELSKLKEARTPIPIGDDGEVEYVDFVWKERNVHCETFRNVELNGSKEAFQSNKILSGFDEKMAEYDKSMFENVRIRAELAPYLVANEATEKKLESSDHIKDLITTAYEDMNNLTQDEWKDKIEDGKNFLKVDEVKGFRVKKALYMKRYATVTEKWPSWGSGGRKWTTDKKMQSDRNLYASDPKNNILRRPPVNGDRNSIYIALDKNNQVIVFLDPQGIPWAYDEDISQRLRTDSHEFYSKTKCPNPKSTNKRHVSQYAHLKDNPAIKPWWCGSDHYGHWHANGHTHDPILETGDSTKLNATQKQLLLQFLKYTGGPMTRVLDFWFGVWEPDLRKRYREIYADSPEFARLPPVNEDHPETYCLRVSVCNRPTDEHRDQNDMKGGLTGLVHLGDFKGMLAELKGIGHTSTVKTNEMSTGGAMCFNQLGIALDGYGDGAVLLIRGTELKHYVSQWSGNYRYAFDHTTHQSVAYAIDEYEKKGRWGPKKDPEAPKPPKGPKGGKGGKKPKKPEDEDDEEPDGGDAPGKPDGKTKKRPCEDDEEKPDSGPAPKKLKEETNEQWSGDGKEESEDDPASKQRGKAGATRGAPRGSTRGSARGARQVRTPRGKSKQIKEEQSGTQLPRRNSRKGAQKPRQKK